MWNQVGSQSVLLIRTYAFFNRNVYILIFLLFALSGVISYQLYVDTTQMLLLPFAKPPFDKGPCLPMSKPHSAHLLGFFIAPLLFDTVVTAMTVWKAFTIRRRNGGPNSRLIQTFLREGRFNFCLINGIFYLQPRQVISAINIPLSVMLGPVLACRLILDLRERGSETVSHSEGTGIAPFTTKSITQQQGSPFTPPTHRSKSAAYGRHNRGLNTIGSNIILSTMGSIHPDMELDIEHDVSDMDVSMGLDLGSLSTAVGGDDGEPIPEGESQTGTAALGYHTLEMGFRGGLTRPSFEDSVSYLDLPDLAALSQAFPIFSALAEDPVLHRNRVRIIAPSRVKHSLFGAGPHGIAFRPTISELIQRGVIRGFGIERRWRMGAYLYSRNSIVQYENGLRLTRRHASDVISVQLRRRLTRDKFLESISHVLPNIESASHTISRILLPAIHQLKWSIQRDKISRMVRIKSCVAPGQETVGFGIWHEKKGCGIVQDGERVRLAICPGVKKMVRFYERLATKAYMEEENNIAEGLPSIRINKWVPPPVPMTRTKKGVAKWSSFAGQGVLNVFNWGILVGVVREQVLNVVGVGKGGDAVYRATYSVVGNGTASCTMKETSSIGEALAQSFRPTRQRRTTATGNILQLPSPEQPSNSSRKSSPDTSETASSGFPNDVLESLQRLSHIADAEPGPPSVGQIFYPSEAPVSTDILQADTGPSNIKLPPVISRSPSLEIIDPPPSIKKEFKLDNSDYKPSKKLDVPNFLRSQGLGDQIPIFDSAHLRTHDHLQSITSHAKLPERMQELWKTLEQKGLHITDWWKFIDALLNTSRTE
ncbi:hypothetical protein H0H81_003723 [Sphagnurus paluster]|uniref:Uncharacterized protein n=1 Tax=Sphagnurus paluster TaxID=117069 RepID=A0A9P7K497_9AGAR|nr:hypothetical protein H0H81_003723 [Sphagnurus paluster]